MAKTTPPATSSQATTPDLTLELDSLQFKQLVDEAVRWIGQHIDTLADQHACNTEGGRELARSVVEPLPTSAADASDLFQDLFTRLIPRSFNTASPGYLAFIPGGGLLHAAIADLIADAVNRYVGVWAAAPALAQLEATVIRWFCDIVGYPAQAGGFLTTGGSLANWTAIFTARQTMQPDDLSRCTVYASNQSHHCVEKAVVLAGLPRENIRWIDVDERFCVRVDQFADQVERDKVDGWNPLVVVGSAGTTNTGAVDDLQALAAIAQQHRLWFHVDAAYGGFFMLTQRGQRVMQGIEQADSITLDPHKALFLPYGNGCLLVKQGRHLKQAHTLAADYMPDYQEEPEFVDFCEISPELSRDFRGLRIWLPLKMHGIQPFVNNLNEKIDLIHWIEAELRQLDSQMEDELEIVAAPQLTVLAFRLKRAGYDQQALNQLNRDLLRRINEPRRVYLTPTTVNGCFVIRICVVSFRTHMDRMQECLQLIRQAIPEATIQPTADANSSETE